MNSTRLTVILFFLIKTTALDSAQKPKIQKSHVLDAVSSVREIKQLILSYLPHRWTAYMQISLLSDTKSPKKKISCLSFSPDSSRLAVALHDDAGYTLQVWNMHTLTKDYDASRNIEDDPDAFDETIRPYSSKISHAIWFKISGLEPHESNCIFFTDGGTTINCAPLHKRNIFGGRLSFQSAAVSCITVTPNNNYVIYGHKDKKLILLDNKFDSIAGLEFVDDTYVTTIAISSDGEYICLGFANGCIALAKTDQNYLATDRKPNNLQDLLTFKSTSAIKIDGQLLSAIFLANGNLALLYYQNDKTMLTVVPYEKIRYSSSPLATAFKFKSELDPDTGDMVFTPDNQHVVLLANEEASVHEVNNERLMFNHIRIEPMGKAITAKKVSVLQFSPCGNYCAAGLPEATLRIWKLEPEKLEIDQASGWDPDARFEHGEKHDAEKSKLKRASHADQNCIIC